MTSRRRFLQLVGGAGLAIGGCKAQPGGTAAADRPGGTGAPPENQVVIVRDSGSVRDGIVDGVAVAAMLKAAMAELAPDGRAQTTWNALFGPEDTVAMKVNCLAGPPLSSHPEVVEAIAKGLASAGLESDDIVAYDRERVELEAAGLAGSETYQCVGTDQLEPSYDAEPTIIGKTGSCFSRIVSEHATAIVNLPVLKDHDLAGLSGALKNHFGSIHNPSKLHTNHCCPHVADINAAPQIRGKHRLVVFDALSVCYDGGPGYKPETTVDYGALIVATDPVAADAVALKLLEELRAEHGCPPLEGTERHPKYLEVAEREHGLGVADVARLDVTEIAV